MRDPFLIEFPSRSILLLFLLAFLWSMVSSVVFFDYCILVSANRTRKSMLPLLLDFCISISVFKATSYLLPFKGDTGFSPIVCTYYVVVVYGPPPSLTQETSGCYVSPRTHLNSQYLAVIAYVVVVVN